jgi:hypothetical protein
MRAQMLLAEVHALLGSAPPRSGFAEGHARVLSSVATHAAWELAFTHAIYAHAAYAAQRHRGASARPWRGGWRALQALADPEDREMVEKTFSQVPAP